MRPTKVSDWYELVRGPDLEQGDVIRDCPIFKPPLDLNLAQWPPSQESVMEAEIVFRVAPEDVIVLSQSCDLAAQQKTDIGLALLCPFWSLNSVGAVNPFLNSSYGKEQCRRGNLPAYHMIAECDSPGYQHEISIVSFREVWSLPLAFVRNFAAKRGRRARLRSPYREHLAQAFARYFMRVGLPADIPAFTSHRSEQDLMQKLTSLDSETRERILQYFSKPSDGGI